MRISVLDHSPASADTTPAEAFRNSIELAKLAEQCGYHRFWLAEHHALVSHPSPAPEILITRIATETERIRVGSGGVLLSLYSPMKVAEVFRTLQALYPGRIDLGIGRSFGALDAEVRALGQDPDKPPTEDEFQRKLTDLLGFLGGGFPDGHPYAGIPIMPTIDSPPPVWLLGSSPASAVMAARNQLPYAYAHFIKHGGTREAVETYQSGFPHGQTILGVGVYCAETEAEAQRLYSSHRLLRQRLPQGIIAPVPSPDEAAQELTGPEPVLGDWPRCTVGTPQQVRDELTAMCATLHVDEIVVMAFIHDHKARMRSYELLAETLS